MDRLGVGFIGCGRISDLHYPGYLERSDARVIAVCDTNEALGKAKQSEWGAEKFYQDYRELLADDAIDAVEILSPQKLHEPMVIEAAKAGKHIALQKPMTISLESTDRMLEAIGNSDILFRVSDNYLFYPPIVLAKKMIEEGVIGTPLNLRIKMITGGSGGWDVPSSSWAWRAAENAEGRGFETFDHGHHLWAVAWYLMGSVERVSSWIDSLDGIIDSPAVIMWKYKDGPRYGCCEYAITPDLPVPSKYYANDEWFEITGSKGIIVINRCTGNILEGPGLSFYNADGWHHVDDIATDWKEGFIGATHNFIDAIKGTAQPLLNGEQAREIMKLNLAISKSSRVRREVYVDELDAESPWVFTKKKIREEISRRKAKKAGLNSRQTDPSTLPGEDEVMEMTEKLAERCTPEKAGEWHSAIHVELTGGKTRQPLTCCFRISGGKADIESDCGDREADLKIRVPFSVWRDILIQASSVEEAFLKGELELEGNIEDGLKLREVFDL